MSTGGRFCRVATLALASAAALGCPGAASAQLGAAGPYGAAGNYSYYGGVGPYGWGPYGFGWGGFTTAGVRPAMPPPGEVPDLRYQIIASGAARPSTADDLLRRQSMASALRDRQRQALSMETKFDVATGRPRTVPARVAARPLPLDRRLETLFKPDGTIAWPAGLAEAAPAARRVVEQAALLALEEYRLQGRAGVADVTYARQALEEFAGPVFARLAATDDALSYQSSFGFYQDLDATLIDLADPPAPAAEPGDAAPEAEAAPADTE